MPRLAGTPLTCPRCDSRLQRTTLWLRCSQDHAFPVIDGVADLSPAPAPGSTGHIFDSPYGAIYDYGVQHPGLASILGRAVWGSDLSAMYSLMDRGVTAPASSVILDVPAGGAPVLQRAQRLDCTYIGVDLSMGMLQRAARLCERRGFDRATLLRADAADLPMAAASVDRALCFNSLHVIPDKRAVLRELARVLKPGAQLWASALVRPAALHERVLRPWTARGGFFLHLASAEEIRDHGRHAGFSQWRQQRDGAMLVIRARR